MVEYVNSLDAIFHSLADPTRRDILERVSARALTVGEIAKEYDISLAAISKHLQVLEKAKLIFKRKNGKEQIVTAAPAGIASAADYLAAYQLVWESKLDALEHYLKEK
jgi:DNA-binding transcriptional ArsR family regulator